MLLLKLRLVVCEFAENVADLRKDSQTCLKEEY